MTERGHGGVAGSGSSGTEMLRDTVVQNIHPILERETAPDVEKLDAYDIDSELKEFLSNPLVVDQLERVDTVYEVPPEQTNAILDTMLREDGPVAINSLMDDNHFEKPGNLKEAIFVLENRNIIETRAISEEEYVAFHNGGLEAIRRARYRDTTTVRMIEDEFDREPKDDPLVNGV